MESENDEVDGGAGDVLVDRLKEDLESEKKRNQELLTRLKYLQADFENYRKRTEREMKEAGESLVKSLLAKLVVIQDELDLAVKHSGPGAKGDVKEGIRMVQKNLQSLLESVGVERIECVGEPFNPSLHDAVEKVQGNSSKEDFVLEEVRPGYTFRGQLLRPSMVKVELAAKVPREEARVD